ncbi:MAG: cation:proton antiporter [Eubacteriales bacterium]|nr:cation:proton antiporter [Eubacteriales bacterium]
MQALYYIAVLIFGGLIFARLVGKLNLPDVTGYLLAGLVLGPWVSGLLPESAVSSLGIISQVALSLIAFSIGNEMKIDNLKRLGSGILIVTICEALGAFFVVTAGLILIFKSSVSFALVLGSIACATAPASTLLVIKQYRAKGELVDVLLPVVALDDAVCIMVFGIASSVARSLTSGEELQYLPMLLNPLKDIVLAVLLGAIAGFVGAHVLRFLKNEQSMISFMIASIFGLTALTLYVDISSLLTLMVFGFTMGNLQGTTRRYQQLLDPITPPIFIAFFVLSGADLNLSQLTAVGALGIFYIIARVLGKALGAFLGTKKAGFSKEVQKYLGFTLMPQAGVAIGLSLLAVRILPAPEARMVRTIILAATLIYELLGPLVAKLVLEKAGCIESKKTLKAGADTAAMAYNPPSTLARKKAKLKGEEKAKQLDETEDK